MNTPMALSPRARTALESICNTFAPAADGLPSAGERGVPDAILEAMGTASASDRRQFAALLSLWNLGPMALLGGLAPSDFSRLSQEQREQVLRSWRDSRLPQRRAAFHALRKASLLMYYMLPGDNGSNPVWDGIGYPGPLGRNPEASSRTIKPTRVTGDTTLECDVCVVGSGAGGGTAAGVLAQAGLDVVVLEAGGHFEDADFDGAELTGTRDMYLDGGGTATVDNGIGLLAGACLGGGTTVNFTTSFKTPDDVREEWASHGVAQFRSHEFDLSLEAVCERLGVNKEHNNPSKREQRMQQGLTQLGWHSDFMPRNVRGCDQGRNCGYCGYGCRLGAKQSTVKTWLTDAQQAGGRILVETSVSRVTTRSGRATGVEATTRAGHNVRVKARAVVVACGAIHTPAVLVRSGLTNPNIGRHLRLHPATVAWGLFDEPIDPWEGTMQAIYSDQFRRLQGNYGVKLETAAVHPSTLVAFGPWADARQHRRMMSQIGHLSPIGVLLRDRDAGHVQITKDGRPLVHYKLSKFDTANVRQGMRGAARLLEAAGAERISSSHAKPIEYAPGPNRDADSFLAQMDAYGWEPGRCNYASFHLMGSARMGGSPLTSATSPNGETWDVRGLYVCDGSSFPSASGVNPMISIEAIAHMTASRLARKLI